MLPTWAGVVSAISLLIIALAALAVAAAVASTAFGLRAALRGLQGAASPAIDDLRHVVATVRTEVDALAAASRAVRVRVADGTDAVAARLAALDAMVDELEGEVRAAVDDLGATFRTVRRAASLVDIGALFAGRAVRRRRRKT